MAFNKAPSSWLTGYTYTSNQISFNLSGDYTAASQDAISLIFRVTDEILQRYTAKGAGDRPIQWESTATIAQATSSSPNSLKTITNKFVLDAELFYGIAIPSLQVTITAPDMVYTGYAYGAASYVAPTGSVVTLTYSADGGQTFTGTAPTARGSYIARIVATKDGRSGTARAGFVILKSTPTLTVSSDIEMEYSAGTMSTNFYSAALITSVISTNPAVVSVLSFTTGGAVVLQRNGVGQADITASTAETSEYYPAQASMSVILTLLEATITTPADLPISASNGLSQAFTFTTNFTLTAPRYALMTFSSNDTDVATISKGSTYPPTINIISGGNCSITAFFPGDSAYGEATSTTALTITGLTPVQAVTIAKGPSQALFSGDDGIVVTAPASPYQSGAITVIQIGLDGDNNGELDGQIPTFPYVFTITIANSAGAQGTTGALSTTFTNSASNNWISFATSGNVITATISSLPTSINNGVVSGGSIFATKAAASGVLNWTGQFDISVYKTGPRFRVLASGLSGTANSTFTEITQSSLTLNSNGEYTEWLTSDVCCPHVIKMKVVKADGVGSGNISVEALDGNGASDHTGFDFGATSIVVSDGVEFNFNVNHGGTSIFRAYLIGGSPTYQKDIEITATKFTPTLSSLNPSLSACAGAGVQIDGALQGIGSEITLVSTPQALAWDGETTSRIAVSFSSGAGSLEGNYIRNNGKTLVKIVNGDEGDAVMSCTLAATNKYNSVNILRNYRTVKPYLFMRNAVATKGYAITGLGVNENFTVSGSISEMVSTLFIGKCSSGSTASVDTSYQYDSAVPIIYTTIGTTATSGYPALGGSTAVGTAPSRRATLSGTNSLNGLQYNLDSYSIGYGESVYATSYDSSEPSSSFAHFAPHPGGFRGSNYTIYFRPAGYMDHIKTLQNYPDSIAGDDSVGQSYLLGTVKLYFCPSLPYRDGSLGDYYKLSNTTPVTLTYVNNNNAYPPSPTPLAFTHYPQQDYNAQGVINPEYFQFDSTIVGYEIPTIT